VFQRFSTFRRGNKKYDESRGYFAVGSDVNFLTAFRSLFDRRFLDLLLFLVVLIGGSVVAVQVGNKFGSLWGGVVGIAILPLAIVRLPGTRRQRPKPVVDGSPDGVSREAIED
jgi:hypothetical protein